MQAYMKFVFFSVFSENGENGLGYEGAVGGNPPRICGLEPPLKVRQQPTVNMGTYS